MTAARFAAAFAITYIVESAAAYALGYRGRLFYKLLFLINLISNPALNYILSLLYFFGLYSIYDAAEFILELSVVIFEWRILYSVFKKDYKKLLLLSAVMNGASFGAGLLLSIWGFWKLF